MDCLNEIGAVVDNVFHRLLHDDGFGFFRHSIRDAGEEFHQHFMCALFRQKCFAQLSLVAFQLCNFWRQNIGEKFAHKMLMKLTPG